jgi:DNA gyrase subunit A
MRLSRLSALERDKIETERTELEQKIAWLTEVLASEARIFGVIKEELQDLKSKYGDARRTEIEDVVELNERDFVEENATRMVNGIEALREYVNNVRG